MGGCAGDVESFEGCSRGGAGFVRPKVSHLFGGVGSVSDGPARHGRKLCFDVIRRVVEVFQDLDVAPIF